MNAIKILGSENLSRQALRETMARLADVRPQVLVDRTLPRSAAAETCRAMGRIVWVPDHA